MSRGPKNAQVFHNAVVKAVGMYNDCLRERSARSCVYDKKLYLRSMVSFMRKLPFPVVWGVLN